MIFKFIYIFCRRFMIKGCIFHARTQWHEFLFVNRFNILKPNVLLTNWISMENLLCHNSVNISEIATKFCTYHDSTAVMSCAKLCSVLNIEIEFRAKRNFHRIWIAMEKTKTKVKWLMGLNGHQFAYIFKCLFLNENVDSLIKILLKFFSWSKLNNAEVAVRTASCSDLNIRKLMTNGWIFHKRTKWHCMVCEWC